MAERGSSTLRKLDKYIGIPLTFPVALHRKLFEPGHIPTGGTTDLKIGVLCLGAIGDLLLVSALIQGLRQKNQAGHIALLTSRANAGAIPLINNVDAAFSFSINRPDLIIRHARQAKYDLFFDCSQWARIGNIVSNLSGAGATVGFNTPGQWRATGYTTTAAHRNDRHELENFLALGQSIWPDLAGRPSLAIPQEIIASCRDIPHNTIFCHMWPAPGAGRHLKMWPEKYWANLMTELIKNGFHVCLTGSVANMAETDTFRRKYFAGLEQINSIAGQCGLLELAALLGRASGVVSVNTGIMHLAALLGAPTVGLHGATNPMRWGPVGKSALSLVPRSGRFAYLNLGFEYPPHVENSMDNLPVEDVIDALHKLHVMQ